MSSLNLICFKIIPTSIQAETENHLPGNYNFNWIFNLVGDHNCMCTHLLYNSFIILYLHIVSWCQVKISWECGLAVETRKGMEIITHRPWRDNWTWERTLSCKELASTQVSRDMFLMQKLSVIYSYHNQNFVAWEKLLVPLTNSYNIFWYSSQHL